MIILAHNQPYPTVFGKDATGQPKDMPVSFLKLFTAARHAIMTKANIEPDTLIANASHRFNIFQDLALVGTRIVVGDMPYDQIYGCRIIWAPNVGIELMCSCQDL